MNVYLKSVLVVVLLLNLGSINSLPVTGQNSTNSTTVAPVVTITNATQTEKPGFLKELFDEVIDEVEDFFDFNGNSNEEVKSAPIVNSQTTIHTQTVIIKNGMVVNETHTVETVNDIAPIVTVLAVNATTIAPETVILDNISPKTNTTVSKSTSIIVIRKKSSLLPSNLFQKMMDILNQPGRVIPQIEVPEDSNIVVDKFHY